MLAFYEKLLYFAIVDYIARTNLYVLTKITPMKQLSTTLVLIVTFYSLFGCQNEQDSTIKTTVTNPDSFSFERSSGGLPFRLMLPRVYDKASVYPLVIVLHSSAERGNDNKKHLQNGSALFLRDSIRTKYPAIVVFPQCPIGQSWEFPWASAKLEELLMELQSKYPVDKARIYLGGLSDGAGGTYALVPRNPMTFAAAFAVAGHGDASLASSMKTPRWWVFHGDQDLSINIHESEKMVEALRGVGASVKFTIYPGVGHSVSADKAWNEANFCQWLFSSRK